VSAVDKRPVLLAAGHVLPVHASPEAARALQQLVEADVYLGRALNRGEPRKRGRA
jgi:hypothetical protein